MRVALFSKILIANRGEIACRIATTCRRLGIECVAVFSEADANAKHVALCDEAVAIGAASAAHSYLRGDAIIAAALRTGAQAVHPGYGFLSENAAFAQACEAAGLVFIGPPAAAIAAMGSKAAAKTLMQTAPVPLVPGYHGDDQDPAVLRAQAQRIGYPILLKASAGGGGKGMRIVEQAADFDAALMSCRREAASSFGDERILIEKYLTRPRHVEVQVFADTHGNAVYLFDRDCSVQRRHQKVLEEAPAPGLTDEVRRAMGEAAVAAARAVGYVGAGTVEFIMEGTSDAGGAPSFYFMEMNTRLQVEHPVTEMITGLDLVEWQLRVAAGEPLPLPQDALRVDGHAIEARLYAEHPERGFLPSTGTLRHVRMPQAVSFQTSGPVRIDSGVREGDAITPFYDPMIAKLIVHGVDRADALARMRRALSECEIVGLHTNIALLRRIVDSVPFTTADLDTGLIDRHREPLLAASSVPTLQALALACAALLLRDGESASSSPWDRLPHWRMAGAYRQHMSWRDLDDDTVLHAVFERDGHARLSLRDASVRFQWSRRASDDSRGHVDLHADPHADLHDSVPTSAPLYEPLYELAVSLDDVRMTGRVFVDGDAFHVFTRAGARSLLWENPLAQSAQGTEGEGRLTAPMPGKIIAVLVATGDVVDKDAPLLVMEAMKMEHTIVAPGRGVVGDVLFRVGDQVVEGAQLLMMTSSA